MSFSLALLLTAWIPMCVNCLHVARPTPSQLDIPLQGEWSATNANGSIVLTSCHVPGDIFTDLQMHGVIGDPLAGYGDITLRWVAYENWTYSRRVDLGPSISNGRAILMFEGLQVIANVTIDGILVGRAESDFKYWEFDITGALRQSRAGNKSSFLLEVRFESSPNFAQTKYMEYTMTQPDCPAYLEDIPHRNFIRAEQSSFGWDWGPAFAPVGIFGNVTLKFLAQPNSVLIEAIVPQVFSLPYKLPVLSPLADAANAWQVDVTVNVHIFASEQFIIQATVTSVSLGPSLISSSCTSVGVLESDTLLSINCSLLIHNATLWWPRGYGAQTMHALTVKVVNGADVLASELLHIGLRSVELLSHDDPLRYTYQVPGVFYPGLGDKIADRPTMYFRVNGVPIFAKGANVIPFEAFRARINNSLITDVLESVILGNMNMLRVWGGGVFKEDYFYQQCDSLGILVWQEMMFACAEYPINVDFLNLAKSEISFQLRRLARHPSIVLWSGNNEDEVYDDGPGSPYEVLDYETVLYQIIREDSSRPIWPSSPSIGFSFGVTSSGLPLGSTTSPSNFTVGKNNGGSDSHYYNYFKCPDLASFPETNFGSEYGFQSLPWLDNIQPVSTPQDWSLFSEWMEHRQHHPDGNAEIYSLLQKNFADIPDPNSTDVNTFKRIIFLSQLQQVLCLSEETAFYRRGRNMPYRTMGSLYWQLNQNWQAPSWTSMEYGGEWKILHYAMAVAFLPIRITAFVNETTSTIVAHITNDYAQSRGPFTLRIDLLQIAPKAGTAGRIPFHSLMVDTVPGLSGLFAWSIAMPDFRGNTTLACPSVTDCAVQFTLADNNGDSQSPPYTLWLSPLKDYSLDANAQVRLSGFTLINESVATVNVSLLAATGPAVFVLLRSIAYRGYFSSNLLTLVAGDPPMSLTFTTRPHVTDGKLVRIVSITDFMNSLEVQLLNGQS